MIKREHVAIDKLEQMTGFATGGGAGIQNSQGRLQVWPSMFEFALKFT